MLILEGMRQLVGHDGLLTVEVDPVGEVKLLRLGLVIARDLLREQADEEGAQAKSAGVIPSF